jgi:GntR family transcriptional regulator, transcriptional repressor for pyruvate dehydrogenase complex
MFDETTPPFRLGDPATSPGNVTTPVYDVRMSSASEQFTVRVPKTAELIAGQLRSRIVRGEVGEGDALPPESELMAQFGVSRPTLREAFRILEHEALITVHRGARGGARVHAPKSDVAARHAGLVLQYRGATLADVFEARAIVESPAAGMLASRRDRATAAKRLERSLVEQQEDPASPWRGPEFHRLVVELTGNQTLLLLTTMLEYIQEAAARSALERQSSDLRLARRGLEAHQQLIESIRAGDGAEAEAAWRRHLVEVGAAFQKTHGGGATVLDVLE